MDFRLYVRACLRESGLYDNVTLKTGFCYFAVLLLNDITQT